MSASLYAQTLIAPEIAAVFADDAVVRAMLRFEVTLARVQAKLGMVPAAAAQAIEAQAGTLSVDPAELARQGAIAGSLAIAFVQALTAHVARVSQEAARFVHFGTTSQDVLDSALALCTQQAIDLLERAVSRAADGARALTARHASTPVLARTLLQPAGVTTIGYKTALWTQALLRGRQRIEARAREALAVSLGGAVGDLAAYGERGSALRAELAGALGLADPGYCWHTQRDAWLGLAADVALATGSMSKIAHDIALMAQSELGEVAEPQAPGRGGSSALPHKRNPVLCMRVIAVVQGMPGLLASLLAAMPQEHERALGLWQAELAQWPQIFLYAVSAADALATLLEGLSVDVARCRANIEAQRGLVFADKLNALWLPALGKRDAQALLAALCRRAQDERRELRELALESMGSDVRLQWCSAEAVDACFDIDRAAQASARLALAALHASAAKAVAGLNAGEK